MEENKIVALRQPGDVADPLTEALRNGARALLTQAVEAEVAEALAAHAHLTTDDGRRRLVRHGHMPERTIQTGIGPVAVRQPRVRDRGGANGERIRFSSTLLPRYARRTKSLDALLPSPVPARHFQRRHAGSPCCFARQGRAEPFAVGARSG